MKLLSVKTIIPFYVSWISSKKTMFTAKWLFSTFVVSGKKLCLLNSRVVFHDYF